MKKILIIFLICFPFSLLCQNNSQFYSIYAIDTCDFFDNNIVNCETYEVSSLIKIQKNNVYIYTLKSIDKYTIEKIDTAYDNRLIYFLKDDYIIILSRKEIILFTPLYVVVYYVDYYEER